MKILNRHGTSVTIKNDRVNLEDADTTIKANGTSVIVQWKNDVKISNSTSVVMQNGRYSSGWIDNARILSKSEFIKMLKK